ncbi:hypothetical protein ACHOLT_11725 [Desulfitobacterium sp. Sab5]|uniref:hypothetical protein n=1 Tax=Desulfitobacterium nosdiversum TaxID=3375356 RepID=UPI003CF0FFCA
MVKDANYYTGLIFGELNAYCYMVKTGCKPVAEMGLQDRHLEEAKEIVGNNQLKFYSEFLYEGWSTIYIYKHDYLLDIIKSLPEKPNRTNNYWIYGKLFGYSDEEIRRFIEEHSTS